LDARARCGGGRWGLPRAPTLALQARRRCSLRLAASQRQSAACRRCAMESDSDDVPLAQRVPKAAPRPAPAANPVSAKRKAPPSAGVAPKRPKPAAAASKPRGDAAPRAKKAAESADDSSSDEDEEGDAAKAGRSASRAAKKLEKDRKAVAEMTRIKKGVRLSHRRLRRAGCVSAW